MIVTKEDVYQACYGAATYIRKNGMAKATRIGIGPRGMAACGTGALGIAICGDAHLGEDDARLAAAFAAMDLENAAAMYHFNDYEATTELMLLRKFEEGMRRASPGSGWEVPEYEPPRRSDSGWKTVSLTIACVPVTVNSHWVSGSGSGTKFSVATAKLSQVSAQAMADATQQLQAALNAMAGSCTNMVSPPNASRSATNAAWLAFCESQTPRLKTSRTVPPTRRSRACGAEGRLHAVSVSGYRRRQNRRGAHKRILVEEEALIA